MANFTQSTIGELENGQTAAEMFIESWNARLRPEVGKFRTASEVPSGDCREVLLSAEEVYRAVLGIAQFGPLAFESDGGTVRLIGRGRPGDDGTLGRPVCLAFQANAEGAPRPEVAKFDYPRIYGFATRTFDDNESFWSDRAAIDSLTSRYGDRLLRVSRMVESEEHRADPSLPEWILIWEAPARA